mgnify:CR=1 FL=1
MEQVKCLIIGSGPAGYTAAIYTARAGLNPVLYEGITPGGQLTTTTEIENFPSHPEGIDGNELMSRMRAQAERFGTDIRFGAVTKAELGARPFVITIDGEKQIEAESVIICTGATAKYLGLPSEERFKGMGVSAQRATVSSTARRTSLLWVVATPRARRRPTWQVCAVRSI